MPEYEQAPEIVLTMAQEIIEAHHKERRLLHEARICFVMRDEAPVSRGKQKWGAASKFPDKLRPHLDYDFLIWLAKDVWVGLTEEQRMALIDHELCHCDYSQLSPSILPHDVEEFSEIVERYGYWKYDLMQFKAAGERSRQIPLFDNGRKGEVGTISVKSTHKSLEEALEAGLRDLQNDKDIDPLLDEALNFAKKYNNDIEQITSSRLQRHLRIGYPRAAKLREKLREILEGETAA